MYKIINTLMTLFIMLFIFGIFKYYLSSKNIENKKFNRSNITQILKNKISDLPVLLSDTDKVIEFNNSFNTEIKDDKERSFWDLLKTK